MRSAWYSRMGLIKCHYYESILNHSCCTKYLWTHRVLIRFGRIINLKTICYFFWRTYNFIFFRTKPYVKLALENGNFIYRCNHVRLAHTRGVDIGRRQIIGEQYQINYFVLLSTNTLYLINR